MNQMIGKMLYKNTLEIPSLEHVQSMLPMYRIIDVLGVGDQTVAYRATDKDGNEVAIKTPNFLRKNIQLDRWMEQQEKSYHPLLTEYQGDVGLPRLIEKGSNYVVEKLITGNELNVNFYDSLPIVEKEKIAKDLAGFFNYMHQIDVSDTMGEEHRKRQPYEETIAFMAEKKIFSDAELSRMEKEQTNFINRDKTDEKTVFSHGDIRSQNVFYDVDTKQVSIIDFGLACKGSVYRDFVPGAAASFGMSYDLLARIIHQYNKMPKEKPIQINADKVRQMAEQGICDEMSSCWKRNEATGKANDDFLRGRMRANLSHLRKYFPDPLTKGLQGRSKKTL